MKTFIKKTLLAAGLFVTSSTAFAASTDFIDNGTYTTDTLSGLDWLDVTMSVNQSYNYVSSQFGVGGVYEGWRYATGDEFNQMVSNYTSVINSSYEYVHYAETQYTNNALIDGLVTLLGDTYAAYRELEGLTSPDILAGFEEGSGFGVHYTYGFTADNVSGRDRIYAAFIFDSTEKYDSLDYTRARYTAWTPYRGRPGIGSFLVRDSVSAVPLPAAAWLFMPAMMGFLGLRRKARLSVA